MSTVIRPEVSKKNRYYINKHRYYELKHFCLQYPIWKKALASITSLSARPADLELFHREGERSDPTERAAEAREKYLNRIHMVEKAAWATDSGLAEWILRGVTEGYSYDVLRARYDIPCGKDTYYDRYRRFFWTLSKMRD